MVGGSLALHHHLHTALPAHTKDKPGLEIPPEVLRKFVKYKQVDMVGHVWAGSEACISFIKDYVIL
jgi:hypothetical protein